MYMYMWYGTPGVQYYICLVFFHVFSFYRFYSISKFSLFKKSTLFQGVHMLYYFQYGMYIPRYQVRCVLHVPVVTS